MLGSLEPFSPSVHPACTDRAMGCWLKEPARPAQGRKCWLVGLPNDLLLGQWQKKGCGKGWRGIQMDPNGPQSPPTPNPAVQTPDTFKINQSIQPKPSKTFNQKTNNKLGYHILTTNLFSTQKQPKTFRLQVHQFRKPDLRSPGSGPLCCGLPQGCLGSQAYFVCLNNVLVSCKIWKTYEKTHMKTINSHKQSIFAEGVSAAGLRSVRCFFLSICFGTNLQSRLFFVARSEAAWHRCCGWKNGDGATELQISDCLLYWAWMVKLYTSSCWRCLLALHWSCLIFARPDDPCFLPKIWWVLLCISRITSDANMFANHPPSPMVRNMKQRLFFLKGSNMWLWFINWQVLNPDPREAHAQIIFTPSWELYNTLTIAINVRPCWLQLERSQRIREVV